MTELEYVEVFKHLDGPALREMATFSTKLELMDGEILISENDSAPFDLFVLCKGRIEIISNGSGITSGEVTLSKQDKEIYGEVSWLTGRKRTATIRCHGPVEVIRIDGQQLLAYLQQNPQAGFVIMQAVATMLADSVSQTDQLLKQILWNGII